MKMKKSINGARHVISGIGCSNNISSEVLYESSTDADFCFIRMFLPTNNKA